MFNFLKKINENIFNTLNSKLIPICHLLALLGAHLIPNVSSVRVKASVRTE